MTQQPGIVKGDAYQKLGRRHHPDFHCTFDNFHSRFRGSLAIDHFVGPSGRHLGRPKSVVANQYEQS